MVFVTLGELNVAKIFRSKLIDLGLTPYTYNNYELCARNVYFSIFSYFLNRRLSLFLSLSPSFPLIKCTCGLDVV